MKLGRFASQSFSDSKEMYKKCVMHVQSFCSPYLDLAVARSQGRVLVLESKGLLSFVFMTLKSPAVLEEISDITTEWKGPNLGMSSFGTYFLQK